MSLEASYRVRLRGEASAGELVKALNRIEGVQSVETRVGIRNERRDLTRGFSRTCRMGITMAKISQVAGAALLALAAAVQMSGGTATGGSRAAAQGFPVAARREAADLAAGLAASRPPLALVDEIRRGQEQTPELGGTARRARIRPHAGHGNARPRRPRRLRTADGSRRARGARVAVGCEACAGDGAVLRPVHAPHALHRLRGRRLGRPDGGVQGNRRRSAGDAHGRRPDATRTSTSRSAAPRRS